MLKTKIENRASGLLFYGVTPPKVNTDAAKVPLIASRLVHRLQGTDIDGLILYDIQDESSRNSNPRPFPYLETLDPHRYSETFLQELQVPKVIFNSIGKYTPESFENWLRASEQKVAYSVWVGSPSRDAEAGLRLEDAYGIHGACNSSMVLGGVTIPERHVKKGDEHDRIFAKVDRGCQFFISQCVYNVDSTLSFLSDYYYNSQRLEREMVPIIFTISPCGSLRTLQFMKWLGIEIPRWLENELHHSQDILSQSVTICEEIAAELLDFAERKRIPVGFNIESVAIRKEEIEASIDLLQFVGRKLKDLRT